MAVDTRPLTLTSIHNYNLRNQGWPTEFDCAPNEGGDGGAVLTDPVQYTWEKINIYPSNADIIYFNKLSTAVRVAAIDTYSPWHLRRQAFGNTPAGKGHFIINAFDRNRQAVSGITGIYDPERDRDTERPVSVAFSAGRIWYLMPDGRVYFTQTLTELLKAGFCYQDADPTAEDINELIATDGGKIDLTGISQGLTIQSVDTDVVVLADNGVWSISGEGDEGFTATKHEIRKITSVGAIGRETIVEAEGTIFYWAKGGIYLLERGEVSAQLTAQNITETTIQTFYLDISEDAKRNARGFYDKQSKKILWMYNDTIAYDGVLFRNRYNRVLIFDLVLAAFYTYTLDSSGNYPFPAALIQKEAGTFITSTELVTSGGVTVTSGGVDVTARITTENSVDVKVRILTFAETSTDVWQYTFSEFRADDMLDWKSFDSTGLSYTSFLTTGHDISGNLIAEKETGVGVYVFFKRTEKNIILNSTSGLIFDFPSGCLLQGRWHWSDHVDSGRWSESKQAYKLLRQYIPAGTGVFDYGFEVIQTINQIRGKGRALSLRFDSEAGKDFHLLGWAIPYTAMIAP